MEASSAVTRVFSLRFEREACARSTLLGTNWRITDDSYSDVCRQLTSIMASAPAKTRRLDNSKRNGRRDGTSPGRSQRVQKLTTIRASRREATAHLYLSSGKLHQIIRQIHIDLQAFPRVTSSLTNCSCLRRFGVRPISARRFSANELHTPRASGRVVDSAIWLEHSGDPSEDLYFIPAIAWCCSGVSVEVMGLACAFQSYA